MKQSEVWLPVPSLPGVSASSKGRIRVEPYQKAMPHGGLRSYGGFEGIGQWDGKRYVYILRRKTYKVARLVCEAFHGPAPIAKPGESRIVAMHLDENSRNNYASNLAWGSQKQNLNAPGFIDYCKRRTGENSPTIKGRRASFVKDKP